MLKRACYLTRELCQRVLHPDRLEPLLRELLERSDIEREKTRTELKEIDRAIRTTKERLGHLRSAVEQGALEWDPGLRDQITKRREELDRQTHLKAMLEHRLSQPLVKVTRQKLETFAKALERRLTEGDPAFRRAYMRLFVQSVEVDDDEIRISGSKDALMEGARMADAIRSGSVRSFEQEWRAREDSNL